MEKGTKIYAQWGIVKNIIAAMVCVVLFFGALLVVHAAPSATVTPASSGTGAASSLYTPRYLPDIIKGANGPADMIFFLYKYLMGLVGIVAVGVIMYAGVLYVTSASPQKIGQSHDLIKSALKGIVLLFGAQVLFNTINPNIVNFPRIQSAIQPKQKFTPAVFTGQEIELASSTPVVASLTGDLLSTCGGHPLSECNVTQMRAGLNVAGVGLVPECTGASTVGCISLEGVQQKTLDDMANLAAACPGMVHVTSVTESAGNNGPAHAAGGHDAGNKYDAALQTISGCIKSNTNFERLGTCPDYLNSTYGGAGRLEVYKNKTTGSTILFETARNYGSGKRRGGHIDVDSRGTQRCQYQ